MNKVLLFFVMTLLPMSVFAYDFTIDDIAYKISSVAKRTVEVTYFGDGSTGNMKDEDKSNYGHYRGVVTIPDEVEYEGIKYYVTSIGKHAFIYTSQMDEVILPNSILTIGGGAFYQSNIKRIFLPNNLVSLDNACFMYCRNLKTIQIPENITYLPEMAFGYSGIETIDIPWNVRKIGYCCFSNCEYLKEVTFRGSVYMETFNKHGSLAFSNCKSISIISSTTENPGGFHDNAFDSWVYLHASVRVPQSTIEKYNKTTGWNNFVNIEEDPTLITKFKLSFIIDGVEYISIDLEPNTYLTSVPIPTMEGYTFSGWSDLPTTMPAHDLVVSGSFTANKYLLTYIVDGEIIRSDSIEYNSTLSSIGDISKEGYTFSGWSEIPETMPAHDLVVNGSFTPNKHILIYIVDGKVYKVLDVNYNSSISPEEIPVKEGYTFSGWSEIPETMPDSDVIITGSFTINKYQVKFMFGDDVIKIDSVEYGTVIPLPTSLENKRYTLVEWTNVPEIMPAHDIIIYARVVDGILTLTDEIGCKIYNEKGGRILRLQRGLNIIKYNNGKIQKVIVK